MVRVVTAAVTVFGTRLRRGRSRSAAAAAGSAGCRRIRFLGRVAVRTAVENMRKGIFEISDIFPRRLSISLWLTYSHTCCSLYLPSYSTLFSEASNMLCLAHVQNKRAFLEALLPEYIRQGSNDGFRSEGQSVGALLRPVNHLQESGMSVTLQISHADLQQLRDLIFPLRLVDLLDALLVEHEHAHLLREESSRCRCRLEGQPQLCPFLATDPF